ncbi:MAG: hypothetical protein EBR86_09440 [Planctomycetia bacterium]|nr:hypothetical protein [Planctomycetia bacterium]
MRRRGTPRSSGGQWCRSAAHDRDERQCQNHPHVCSTPALSDECFALEVFDGLRDARAITAASPEDYNHRKPHSSLGFQTPAGFAAARTASASAKASAPAAHAAVCLGLPQP